MRENFFFFSSQDGLVVAERRFFVSRKGATTQRKEYNVTLTAFDFGVSMIFSIEHEKEEDGRWLAEVPELPGVLAYGATAEEAMLKAEALALRIIAERLEQGESRPIPIHFSLAAV